MKNVHFASKNNRDIRFLIGLLTFIVINLVFFIIVYFRPYLGDDIDKCFLYAPEHAITGIVTSPVKVDTFNLWISNIKWYYMNFTGRIWYILVNTIPDKVDKAVVALIITGISSGNTVLAIRLVYGNFRKALEYPLISGVFFGLNTLYYNSVSYSMMWVFTSIYGLSLLLYLGYTNILYEWVIKRKETSIKELIILNFVGFAAGISHEMMGAWFIIIYFILFLLFKFNFKGIIECVRYFMGLIVGYLICFFAPGNFVRLTIPHEDKIRTMSLFGRFMVSVRNHINELCRYSDVGKSLYAVLLVFASIGLVIVIKMGEKEKIIKILICEIIIAISILIWSVPARAVFYGLIGAMVLQNMVLAYLAQVACDSLRYEKTVGIITGLLLLVFIIDDSIVWLPTMIRESLDRNHAINCAVYNGDEQVKIPAYSDIVNRDIMFIEYVDDNEQYSTEQYILFYGVQIIVEDPS